MSEQLKFYIGEKVTITDKRNPKKEPELGTVVGFEDDCPSGTKRSGFCFVIKLAEHPHSWVWRNTEEIAPGHSS